MCRPRCVWLLSPGRRRLAGGSAALAAPPPPRQPRSGPRIGAGHARLLTAWTLRSASRLPFAAGAARANATAAAALPTEAAQSAKEGGAAAGADAAVAKSEEKIEEKKPMGFGMILLWAFTGIGCILFSYYFKQAKYNLAKTEATLLDRCRGLPFYWPPGPKPSSKNSLLDACGLPSDVATAFTEWFIVNDLQGEAGVSCDDVLELLRELGFEESDPACKAFLARGTGRQEHRRLAGCGLQEALALLAEVAVPVGARGGGGWGSGSRPALIRERLGPEAAELLKRKLGGVSPVLSSVSWMQQAMTSPSGGNVGSSAVPFAAPAAQAFGRAGDMSEVDDMDEETHRQLEIVRLERIEAKIMQRLQRAGELTPAEEGRLRDAREELARLK